MFGLVTAGRFGTRYGWLGVARNISLQTLMLNCRFPVQLNRYANKTPSGASPKLVVANCGARLDFLALNRGMPYVE